ncbi:hypothetical protein BSPWISOXPB_7375 [uncultured Gammaproteobacteria bacterium]|nr:hypothetical protein BSPWISOXPB_7375 [uncultured Gammaproteobacteria bacterium]
MRIGSANKLPDGQHGFNDIIDNYAGEATRFDIPTKGPGGSIIRTSELSRFKVVTMALRVFLNGLLIKEL